MNQPPPPGPDALYEAAPCGLLLAGPKGHLLQVNATLCRWLKYRREELLGGMRLQDLLTMGGRIFHQTHLAPLLRMQGSVAEVKLELRTREGEVLPMLMNLAERLHGGELLLHASAMVVRDRDKYERELLLQRRRAEDLAQQHVRDQQELALAQAQAEDRALFAEQMMGIVSHDLRNPLSAIQMSAQLLGMGELPQRQRAVLARISRSVGRAERLISDLLDFTSARLGRGLAVKTAPVDLHELVAETLAELRLAFPDREIRHESAGPGACIAAGDRLAQAVGNLVANAVSYGAPGTPVTVRTRGEADRVEISVHNWGPPIPPALLDRLFEAMVRGEVASGNRGVGLGLFIVREIARAHAGEVRVDSSTDSGTCFALVLPRQPGASDELRK